MGAHLARWRVALRTARRLALRSRGRTLLIVLLISVPAAGGAFLDTYFHTQQLSPQERTARVIGQADAWLLVSPFERIEGIAVGGEYLSWSSDRDQSEAATRDPAGVDPAAVLPPGSRLLDFEGAGRTADVAFDLGDRTVRSPVRVSTGDPLLQGIVRFRDGRAPAAAGELALTQDLADRLELRTGDTVPLDGGQSARIVGVYVHPNSLSLRETLAAPGWLPVEGDGGVSEQPTSFLVELPEGAELTFADVERAAGAGVVLKPRDAFLHPADWVPPGYSLGASGSDGLIGGLVTAGIATIEVVLLAGTAFAVGVRRQLRDAALILASGGRPSDVRRIVLAQGAVIGLAGTAVGTVVGVGCVAVFRSLLQRYADMEFGGVLVSIPELAAIAAVAFGSGVLAAVAPAIGAGRLSVVDALAGRFTSPRRAGRRLPVVGAVTAAVGLGIALLALWRWRSIVGSAPPGSDPDPTAYVLAMVGGFMLLIVGAALTTPLLLSWLSRICGPLPVSLRIAVRDAARQRHRTAPVVASVLVAVAGSAVLAVALASLDERNERAYIPFSPQGVAFLQGADLDANPAVEQARDLLGGSRVEVIRTLESESGSLYVAPDPNCAGSTFSAAGALAIDSPGLDAVVGGRTDEARAILADGKAVVTAPCLIDAQGQIHVDSYDYSGSGPSEPTVIAVAAVYLDPQQAMDWSTPTVVVPTQSAGLFPGFDPVARRAVVIGPTPSERQVEQAQDALGTTVSISVERGYVSNISPLFVGVMAASGLITIAGVAVAVGLAAAESRGDLATLAAVGASPGRRRTFAMGQAALVGLLGAAVGCVVGCIIGFIAVSATGEMPLVLPVLPLAVIGVGVPIVAILGAGAATRSRLPMVRRVA